MEDYDFLPFLICAHLRESTAKHFRFYTAVVRVAYDAVDASAVVAPFFCLRQ